jgi:hypothetical protein
MGAKNKTPSNHFAGVSNIQSNTIGINVCEGKDRQISFGNPTRQKIYEMFLSGGRYSTVELSKLLSSPDPRSHIRYIRGAGVPVSDYWVKTAFSKYKVYFLKS